MQGVVCLLIGHLDFTDSCSIGRAEGALNVLLGDRFRGREGGLRGVKGLVDGPLKGTRTGC